ncbi:MAG: 4Fe-4S protein [Firmicutes bacterium]|nr:4Fe-4S protein [Bacillota bacterium]
MPPVIDKAKCIKCEICAQICPLDVIRVEKKDQEREIVVKYPYECWHCRACIKECSSNAITMRYPLSHMMFYMDVPTADRSDCKCK